jgi:two-component system sensor histidine kinase KdpD
LSGTVPQIADMHGRGQTNLGAHQTDRRGHWRSVLRAFPATVFVAGATLLCYSLRVEFPTVSFVYLIIVVIQSLAGDFLSSTVVSVISFLCLNYFFVPPLFSFRVSDPSDTLALISFLITGLVITRLTSRAHEAANSEKLQREETTRLYELAQQLLALDPEAAIGADLLKQFKSKFRLRAVCFFDGDTAELQSEGDSQDHLEEKTRTAYISNRDFQDRDSGVAVRLLRSRDNTFGTIGFEGLRNSELTAEPLAALAVVMMERASEFRRASNAAAATEAEAFRGALLDALAHEFKTPLATILTAAGGLREVGPLLPAQLELAEAVESEASRLGQLTSRLLRLARLDREEVRPQMELIVITDVVRSIVDQHSRRWPDRRLLLANSARLTVMADRELLWLGLGQLLDNACKYSQPGSEIKVSVESANDTIAVRVWNSGTSIPSSEHSRIFDRFYRGVEARRLTPGSGLGLYVARKIALAHGGDLELDKHIENGGGAAFRFTIPISQSEDHGTESQHIGGR